MSKKSVIWIIIILLIALTAIMITRLAIGNNTEEEPRSFTSTVLENNATSLLVKPDEGEDELRSSDKIVVRVPKDSAVLEDLSVFSVGSKVKITYDGAIMESYPAQINALRVELAE